MHSGSLKGWMPLHPRSPFITSQTHNTRKTLNSVDYPRERNVYRLNRLQNALSSETANGGGCNNGGDGGGGGSNNDDNNNDDSHYPWTWGRILTLTLGSGVALHLITREKVQLLSTEAMPVSIVVPALNESQSIADTIAYLESLNPAPAEIIVADGGSKDNTVQLARKSGAKVIRSGRGRGRQQNAGAHASKSKKDRIYMFVHADSRPPHDAVFWARKTLANPNTVLGGFITSIETDNGWPLLFSTIHNNISSYYAPLFFDPVGFMKGLRCMFGDQSLFCRAEDFWRVGGFCNELPIMEDSQLCIDLHRRGLANGKPGREVQLLSAVNRTSGRRIGAWGNVKSTAVQWRIAIAWWKGASPQELWELYDSLYTDAFR